MICILLTDAKLLAQNHRLYFHFISGCIARKFSDKILQKYWPDIWRSVNQKGNDLRKKQPKASLVRPFENSTDAGNPDEAANPD